MRGAGPVVLSATIYSLLTVGLTWPLATQLDTAIAGDAGDPLFVTWVMHWVLRHLGPALAGNPGSLDGFWTAPIFHPEPNTLALSEHFTAQAIQVLPVWWATGNPILSYNVAFLASFVLTGAATFALTRVFTGGFAAPLLAGTFAAFNPYRLGLELHHLHVLSVQWLPLAMLGLHRFIAAGSYVWLAGAALSVVALNLSAGYFMLFGAPFIAAFAIVDLVAHGRIADRARWAGLAGAAVAAAVCTVPFVLPYLDMQQQHGFARTLDEVKDYSATLAHYQVSLPWLAAPAILAFIGAAAHSARTFALTFLAFALAAIWLSFGPVIQPLGIRAPYRLLYEHVPGFEGLRVVSRYAALALVFLAVAAGIGAARLARVRLAGPVLIGAILAGHLWLSWPQAFPVGVQLASPGLQPPPAYLTPATSLPQIYSAVRSLPADAVLAELPFGDPWYEVRYMYFSNLHGKPLVNGYSGVFPASYRSRQRVLTAPLDDRAATRAALQGVTHVVVHDAAWPDDTGPRLREALERAGARPIAEADGAWLFSLR